MRNPEMDQFLPGRAPSPPPIPAAVAPSPQLNRPSSGVPMERAPSAGKQPAQGPPCASRLTWVQGFCPDLTDKGHQPRARHRSCVVISDTRLLGPTLASWAHITEVLTSL